MKIKKRILFSLILIISITICGCKSEDRNNTSNLLTTDNLIDIVVSAPEGSGTLRTVTINYMQNGEEKSDKLYEIKRIDNGNYNDEEKEQTFTASDYNSDGIVDITVFREFWFPDIEVAHAEIPDWPTVYEYNLSSGFVIASSKYHDYFNTYAESLKEQLSMGEAYMSDNAKLALKRLIYAAENISNGSFAPDSSYNSLYYEDVYELSKGIKE